MNENEMGREEMMRMLMAYDFAAIDMHLYLNTHPSDQRAVSMYNQYVQNALQLRNSYQSKYGPLLMNHFTSKVPWQWTENPFPWEKGE